MLEFVYISFYIKTHKHHFQSHKTYLQLNLILSNFTGYENTINTSYLFLALYIKFTIKKRGFFVKPLSQKGYLKVSSTKSHFILNESKAINGTKVNHFSKLKSIIYYLHVFIQEQTDDSYNINV